MDEEISSLMNMEKNPQTVKESAALLIQTRAMKKFRQKPQPPPAPTNLSSVNMEIEDTNPPPKYIPMNSQTHTHTTILVCSLNVNRSNAVTHAAMHTIGEKTTPAPDLLLIQEPWWEKLNNEHATISFPGWQAILPKSHITKNKCPHITAYHRQSVHLEVTLRTDILLDLDTMILEVKRTGDPNKPTRIINIYNQKQLGENRNIYTVDCLARIHLNLNTPMIITGDWNTHHPDWDDGVDLLTPRVHETLKWVEGNGFILCNEPFVPT